MNARSHRVLIINQYFPPDTSATAVVAADVARAFVRAGHSVTVLAGRPSYQPTSTRPWRLVAREAYEGCVVERVGSTAFGRVVMFGRAANYLSYLSLAFWRALSIRADVIIAMTDPPVAVVVAAAAAALRGIPLVYNVRDLHPEMALAAGMLRPGPLASLWTWLHRWGLRRAARVIVLGDDMKSRVIALGAPADRVVIVRDGAHISVGAPKFVRSGILTERVRSGFAFTVMHAGNIGFSGAWDTLLSAARLAGPDVGFIFVGDGAQRTALQKQSAGQSNVRWLDPCPPDDVAELMNAGDLQVVTVRGGLEGLVVPSKLYTILAAGRPALIVAAASSDAAAIVLEARCGWVANSDDPAAVASAIAEARANSEERLRRADAAAVTGARFERSRLLENFVGEVEWTAAHHGARN